MLLFFFWDWSSVYHILLTYATTQIRAGSVILPIHDTVRVAEEWSVVDNLSNGRAAVSFGSGWHINDFIFFPDRYQDRRAIMSQQIEVLQNLWHGKSILRKNSAGKDIEITIHPKPIQSSLPIWITSAGSADTFVQAGKLQANVLTHLIQQDLNTLSANIKLYREALLKSGVPSNQGKVSLMLHTFLGEDENIVKAKVKRPLKEYLRSSLSLQKKLVSSNGAGYQAYEELVDEMDEEDIEDLLDFTFERYYNNSSLLGTVEKCKRTINALNAIDVDEIACLIDFGVATEDVINSFENLSQLRNIFAD